ncbi:MAG TPA: hypothetical protein VJK30_05675 [Coxiellaceae bacterium]|nr:MAG: hypothetical protein A3E81_01315 [Gammaproteobacteria bacterium RIFCSPHIGHO2_12_FULL_36_30]HLB56800.1 hypothetical protein [Coxiellaceae bacterium]
MKSNFKKALVVILASLFVTSVFAANATTSTTAAPAKTMHKKHMHKHCKKNSKKCKKMHKKAMKKAEVTPAKTKA